MKAVAAARHHTYQGIEAVRSAATLRMSARSRRSKVAAAFPMAESPRRFYLYVALAPTDGSSRNLAPEVGAACAFNPPELTDAAAGNCGRRGRARDRLRFRTRGAPLHERLSFASSSARAAR